MRNTFTAVLEKNSTFTADFETEPYEAGWAGEARWFIRVLECEGEDAALVAHPQISPDGLFWCDEGSPPLVLRGAELGSLALRNFGQWLRLRCEVRGGNPRVKVLIYLTLKE
ncbi:MAG: hypothetical protein IT305_26630 [Chloroflexi bacterium]|nr:hypothetical protein [Chloroflexota bacterium]